jgi:hypothetical protein
MKCETGCPNTDICEHGYCTPHQYSYCRCVTKDDAYRKSRELPKIQDDLMFQIQNIITDYIHYSDDDLFFLARAIVAKIKDLEKIAYHQGFGDGQEHVQELNNYMPKSSIPD